MEHIENPLKMYTSSNQFGMKMAEIMVAFSVSWIN